MVGKYWDILSDKITFFAITFYLALTDTFLILSPGVLQYCLLEFYNIFSWSFTIWPLRVVEEFKLFLVSVCLFVRLFVRE